MKALSILQPYAELIARGAKWIENRGWSTGYRGPLAIHAGKSQRRVDEGGAYGVQPGECALGAVVAVAELVAVLPLSSLRQMSPELRLPRTRELSIGQILAHPHCEGPICWVLRDVRRIAPVPCRGEQGLFDLDVQAAALVRHELARRSGGAA